jgi:hypothetical protein
MCRVIIAFSLGADAQAINEKGKIAGQSLQAMAFSFPSQQLKDELYYQFCLCHKA